MTYSKLANKMAGVSKRDEATVAQLNNLSLMEHIILCVIDSGIVAGKHYKEIYQDCKKRLETVKRFSIFGTERIDKTLDYLFATDETGSEEVEGVESRSEYKCYLLFDSNIHSKICRAIEYKMKLPDWKLLIVWTILMEVLAVLLLISRLMT